MSVLCYELTNRCDIACLHCLRDKVEERRDLPWDLINRTLDEAKQLGIQDISFTGGEPTLHPDYIACIDAAIERGFRWITVTNAHNTELFRILFSDPKRAAQLAVLAISLDGATEETHDRIRGKGSFRKILRTTTLLSMSKIPFRLQMTLTKYSYPEIEQFPLLASQMGACTVHYTYLQPTQKNLAAGLLLSPDDCRRAQIRIHNLTRTYRIGIRQNHGYFHESPLFKCSVLSNNALNIDYLGNMVFCCQHSNYGDASYVEERQEIMADLKEVSLLEGYQRLLNKVHELNTEKAGRAARNEIKGLDLFPCFYCAKQFGKLDWLAGHPRAGDWNDPAHELPESLKDDRLERTGRDGYSLFPDH